MQHPTNDISQSRTTRSKVKHAQTHLASFSSRSASHASPSLSGTYSIGATSSRTSTASNPCALNACSVAGAVSVALGSTTSATCELGWTVVVVPALGSAVRIEEKGSFAPHGYVRVFMRALEKGLEKGRWGKRYRIRCLRERPNHRLSRIARERRCGVCRSSGKRD